MRWKVIISAPYLQPHIDRFRPMFEENDIEIVLPVVKERLSEDELLPLVADVDGVICGDDQYTDRVMAAAPKLKVISKWGTGIDSIDRQAAAKRGIAVRNTPNAFSEPVADSVLGYMLSFARDIPWATDAMRQGEWEKRPAYALREKVLGVVGVGDVGKAVLRRAKGFGMRLLGTDIKPIDPDFVTDVGLEECDLETLLRTADFISLNCDLNATSRHLMNPERFSLLKRTAILINTARGPVVDESALVAALQSKRLAGAGLDVFEVEPLPTNSPLRSMPNVLLAPHNANSSPAAWEHVHKNTINNLLTELRQRSKD